MKYLIDTHVLLWMAADEENLSFTSRQILQSKDNVLFVSLMSFWEISIKHSIGKLELGISLGELLQFAVENKIEVLPVVFGDFEMIEKLPFPIHKGKEHRDPFDRMIISQSITNNLLLISCDEKFDLYQNVNRIW